MNSIRIAVVGCGAIHSTHCDAIQQIEGAKLAAVVDEVPERAAAASQKYGAQAATSLNEIWDEIDAVHLCVPSGLHHKIGMEAALHGKHVLSEKPIDVSIDAANSLIKTCRTSGVKLGVVSQHRFANDIQQVKEAAQSGAMGRLLEGDMYNKWYRSQQYYDSGDWRGTWQLDGGGCLMNQGVHYVDMLQWIMGGVKSVQAQVRTQAHQRIEVEDIANALLEFNNGAVGVIQGSTSVYPGMAERLEIHGLYGTAIIEADRLKVWKVDAEGSQLGLYGDGVNKQPTPKLEMHVPSPESQPTGAGDPTAIWGEQHRLQIEDFVRAIADGRDPFITGEMALEPLKIILAIYKSGQLGGQVIEV